MKKVGDMLRISRLDKKLTLEDVAKYVNVSINYISKLEKSENNNPSDEIIVKLAEILDVDENWLFRSFDKVPLSTRKVLKKNPSLSEQIASVSSDKDLDEESKEKFIEKIVYWYKQLSDEN